MIFANHVAGVRVLLISDSCHSGSVTRGDDSDLDPGMPRARFLPPSVWMKAGDVPAPKTARLPLISGLTRSATFLPTNQLPQNPQIFGNRAARAWKVFA